MTAIAFASSATQQSATATVSVSRPATGAATDIFVAHWSVAGNVADASMTLPSGWTQLAYVSPTGGPTVKMAYKVAVAGGEPASYTFTLSAAAQQTCGIDRFSNVDTSQLSDAYVPVTTNSGTSGTNLTALDVVPESDNAMLIAAFANNVASDAITVPAGFSTAHARTTIVRNTVAYALQTTAGHSSDKVATQAATAGWTAILWAMRPLDLGTVITVTPGAVVSTSKLELGVSLVTNTDFDTGTYRTNFLANAQGVYARMQSFIGGFGQDDPMYDWDGTGTVPTTPNEIRGGVNVFWTGGLDYYRGVATALGIPMDWLVWRLPWQFTYNPNSGVNNIKTDYYNSENRRVRADKMADFQTYLRAVGKYLMQHGARNFAIGSELKGYQQDFTNNQAQTWDYNAYYTWYVACEAALSLAATDAGLTRNDIQVGGPYVVVANQGALTISANAVTFDTRNTVTTPVETIRYKDDAVPATWTMNNPVWGYPNKAPLQATVEFLKLCANNGKRVDFYATDYGTANEDFIIKSTDDMLNAEKITRDNTRWGKRMLQTVAGGAFANLPAKIIEYYIKAEGTVAQTTNTLLAGGGAIPGPFLPANQLRPYFAAMKAIGLAVCVEEGITTPYWWSPFEDANGRTAPRVTGGSGADKQAWYGESFIHRGAIADGEPAGVVEGNITEVGLMNKMFTQHFSNGTQIRAVTVSDPTKVYALPNLSRCIVVNKTAGRKPISVNGVTQTLAPYQTAEVTFANIYTLTATSGGYTSTGNNATLRVVRKITAVAGSYASTGQTIQLRRIGRTTAVTGSYTATGQSATLKAARLLSATTGSYLSTGNVARLVKIPPVSLIAATGSYTSTGQDATLLFAYKLSATAGSYTSTGNDAQLTIVRRLTAAAGAYTATGQNASLLFIRTLSVSTGSYSSSGQDAALLHNRRLSALSGSYAVTGDNAGLYVARTLTALGNGSYQRWVSSLPLLFSAQETVISSANYESTGQAATLTFVRKISAEPGVYTSTGNSANLLVVSPQEFILIAQPGQYLSSGADAQLRAYHILQAESGSYESTGQDATLLVTFVLVAVTGSYTSTGSSAILTNSSEVFTGAPSNRTFVLRAENRTLVAVHEDRTLVVERD